MKRISSLTLNTKLFLFALLVTTGATISTLFGAFDVFAASPTPLSACGTISVPGEYVLTQDITATDTCFTITANAVVLDGAQYTITGDSTTGHYAVTANSVTDLEIKNLRFTNFDDGIHVTNIGNLTLNGNTSLSSLGRGIYAKTITGASLTNNTLTSTGYNGNDTGYGIYIDDAPSSTITGNTFYDSYQQALMVRGSSGSSTISGNSFSLDSAGIWIEACDYGDSGCADTVSGFIISSNEIIDMDGNGIVFYGVNNSTVQNNTISDSYTGVDLVRNSSGNTISGNTMSGGGMGVRMSGASENNNILNNTISQFNTGVYVEQDSHGNNIDSNDIDQVGAGFFIDASDNNDVVNNEITLSNINFGSGSSSPLLFTWNGEEYDYVADVGRGIPRNMVGTDYVAVPQDSITPVGGKYSMKLSQEYNEIVYFDQLSLMTFDHAPGYDVVTSLQRNKDGQFFTVSDTPSNPLVSCTDLYGNDCLEDMRESDDKWSHKDDSNVNSWVMNFGDLSAASRIQLVIESARDYSITSNDLKQIQVKNASGQWVDAYAGSTISSPAGAPRKQVIDLTGKFLTNDYSVKFGYDRTRVNYVAIDTSAQQPYTTNTYQPNSVDLQFRGYTAINKEFFWDHDYENVSAVPEETFAPQTGNFTKYGDVAPLLNSTDDQFVIMHHGDHMDIEFPYVAPAPGLERSVVMYNWATFKHAKMGAVGMTVEPLPFNGMTSYPYSSPQKYPDTPSNELYLKTWNTREVTDGTFGMSLPNSFNTSVTGNTIVNAADSNYIGDKGIYVYYETDSLISDNIISGFYNGIYVENSTGITLNSNIITDNVHDAVVGYLVDNFTITNNTIERSTNDGDGIQVEGSDTLTISQNQITDTTDDGIYISNVSDATITNNIVTGVTDNALDIEYSGPYTITGNTFSSISNGIDIQSDYEQIINGVYTFPGAYSGTFVWHPVYNQHNASTYLEHQVNLTAATTGAQLTFKEWRYTEPCCDGLLVSASVDGNTWDTLGDLRGNTGGVWDTQTLNLDAYIGQTITLRFAFYTDASVLYPAAGVFLDDIRVTGDGTTVLFDDGENGVGTWSVTTGNGQPWALTDVGAIVDPDTVEETKIFTDNQITSAEGFGAWFEGVTEVTFTGNTVTADQWVGNSEVGNMFSDSVLKQGNTYYYADATPSWSQLDIRDTDKNGFADTGKDRPFSQSVLGETLWYGVGSDEYPATQTVGEKRRVVGGISSAVKSLVAAVDSVKSSTATTTKSDTEQCDASQIITQNLRTGARDGKYARYTGGTVTQAHILQAHLNRLGFNSGPTDGILGPLSDGAIKRMQTYLGTKADGYVGPITRSLINNSCGSEGLKKTM